MWKRRVGYGGLIVIAIAYGFVETVGLFDDVGKTSDILESAGPWLPAVLLGGIGLVVLWPDIRRNLVGHAAAPPKPTDHDRIQTLIDEGYAIRAIVEDNNKPLPETRFQKWRATVERELTSVVSAETATLWDKVYGVPKQQFTGMILANRKRPWRDMTVLIEHLERIQQGLQLK